MTKPHTHRGRVYRRCACRTADGKQLGARCPRLTSNTRHGTWTFAVDMPSLTGKRTTMRRGGYPTRRAATAALTRVLECERSGIWLASMIACCGPRTRLPDAPTRSSRLTSPTSIPCSCAASTSSSPSNTTDAAHTSRGSPPTHRRLGHPASPQPVDGPRRSRQPVPVLDPRPRQQVHRIIRRRLRRCRHPDHPHPDPSGPGRTRSRNASSGHCDGNASTTF